MNLNKILSSITPLNSQAMNQTQTLQNNLIKPPGSLGELERITLRLSGITGNPKLKALRKVLFLFASDNGIYDEGVCSSPQDFTRRLMLSYSERHNGAINVLTRQAGAELRLYDLGVKNLGPHENIITHKLMNEGTNNFLHGPAMTKDTVQQAITFGISQVHELAHSNTNELATIIGTGEAGMANTSPACACIMAALNSRDSSLIGRGAGLDDEAYAHKKKVILEALALHEKSLTDPVNILSCVGGLDIAAMAGVFIGGAAYHVPVIADGVISIAGALLAYQLEPLVREYIFASHESLEPAYDVAAKFIGLEPPLRLSMRLGEGTGCALYMQIIDDALAIINGMGTFDEFLGG